MCKLYIIKKGVRLRLPQGHHCTGKTGILETKMAGKAGNLQILLKHIKSTGNFCIS